MTFVKTRLSREPPGSPAAPGRGKPDKAMRRAHLPCRAPLDRMNDA
jgi:hypothetical protein